MIQRIGFLLLCLFFSPALLSADNTDISKQIQTRVERIRANHDVVVAGQLIASQLVLPALYERRAYTPVWTRTDSVTQLFTALENIADDGLDATDYHLPELKALRTQAATADAGYAADYDILLTDSLIRLGYHLLVGKVDPVQLDSNWNLDYTIGDLDSAVAMATAIDNGSVDQLIDRLRPQHPFYTKTRAALAHYRDIQQRGGWQTVADGPVLKPGMQDARVAQLRQRLAASGDMPGQDLQSTQFDADVEAGMKHFQQRHGLDADGLAGKASLAAMNIPVQVRIDQIRVNLERARWVLHKLPDEFVLTDIAGFNVSYFRNGALIWESRAQVGKPYRSTPVFRDQIRYLEINPTWTIPPTILNNDILPRVKRDPDYLRNKNMRVLTFSGEPVDESSINWSLYPGKAFPYMIRQGPGPQNALGRIKFMFPNKHLVYLHDTPSKSLFGRTARAFSSGCIRVEDPFRFGELLLNDPEWDKKKIRAVVDDGKTTRVSLKQPVTVILLYWTVSTDEAGNVIFREDIYNRDAPVLKGLRQPFHFRKGPVLKP